MKKISDLSKHLTEQTGLDKEQRQQWRDTIKSLGLHADRAKDPAQKKYLQQERMRVFQSFSYWKQNYSHAQNIKTFSK